jgi:hypothetical protein
VDGVDVYPDHENPNQFWYVPGTIQLAQRSAKKELSYLWYTDSATDADGTGFLNFEVNTAVSSATLDKIRATIATAEKIAADQITLSTVPYQGGNVNFSVMGPIASKASEADLKKDASVLYTSPEQLVWSAGSSSLVGDNAAVCSVKFTKEGKLAAAMKQAIQKGANNIAALYRLEFLAMRPSVTFKVTGTMEKTIKDFQASIGASIPLEAFILDMGIQAQWQKIMQSTDLKIEVVNFSGEESEGLKWAQKLLLDYVLKNFFEVQLGAGAGNWSPLKEEPKVQEAVSKSTAVEDAATDKAAAEGKEGEAAAEAVKETVKAATIFIPKVNVRAAYYQGSQVNTIDFLYSEMKAGIAVVLPQALVLEGLANPDDYITQVNRAQDPFGLPYKVLVSTPGDDDCAKMGLQTVNVQARYPSGAPREQQTTYNLTTSGTVKTGTNPFPFQYDAKGSADVDYNVEYVFKPSDNWNADVYQYSTSGKTDSGLVVAMPEALLEFLTIDIRLDTVFNWEMADQVVVTLISTRWTGDKRVVFSPDQPTSQSFQIRSDAKFKPDPIQYKVEIKKSNRTVYGYGPETVQDKQILVHDRFAEHVPVFFTASFTDDSVDVVLSYEDGDFQWEDAFTLEKGQKNIKRVVPSLKPLAKASDLSVEYEVTTTDGKTFHKTIACGRTALVKTTP